MTTRQLDKNLTTRQLDNLLIRGTRYYHTKTTWTCLKCHTDDEILSETKFWCKCQIAHEILNLGEVRKSTKNDEQNEIENIKMQKVIDMQGYRLTATEHLQEVKYCNKLGIQLPDDNLYVNKEYIKKYISCKSRNDGYKKQLEEKNDISFTLKGAICYWITISPPEDQDPQLLINLMNEYQTTAMFKDTTYWAFVYEWRSHNPPTGFHCHLLIDRRTDYEPNKDKRTIESKYKKIYKLAPTKISVFISGIKTETVREKKLEYIRGNKIDKKLDKVNLDHQIRKGYGLKDLYEIEDDE